MPTGDHLFGEVTIEDIGRRGYQDGQRVAGAGDLDGRITARGWLRRLRMRTAPPQARRVDRSAGPHGQEPGESTTLRCTPFIVLCSRFPQKITIFADAQAALQRIIRRTRPRTAIRSRGHTTGTRPMGAMKSLRPIPVGPQPCRHRRQREG